MTPVDWAAVWTAAAGQLQEHRSAGLGHLLTEDAVRFAAVVALTTRGVDPSRIAAEVLVPVLAGGKLDLVLDPPAGTVIELKYPRDSRTGSSPDTMTFGELLRDFLRVAAVPADDRWVVQVLNARLLRYVRGILDRHQLAWAWEPGAVMELHPDALAGLPGTTVKAIGTAALPGVVTATCRVVAPVDDDLTLFALQVNAHEHAAPLRRTAPVTASAAAPVLTTVAASTREGARREILDAARTVLARTGGEEFSMADVLAEMRRRGTGYADSTIRTMIASHLCAAATGPGVAGYADLHRTGRGLYRLAAR